MLVNVHIIADSRCWSLFILSRFNNVVRCAYYHGLTMLVVSILSWIDDVGRRSYYRGITVLVAFYLILD